ncbi:MAG: hypothetical protein ACPGRZ_15570 [Alphaproteobacteria bacterium]
MNALLSLLVGLLWLMAAVRILLNVPYLADVMTGLVLAFLAAGLLRLPRHTMILCGVLIVAMLALAQIYGQWEAISAGIAKASIFPAFLATIVLLRAAADQRPEIASARALFGALPPRERDSGIVIGTHVIGAVLQVGVFAVLAPILGKDAPAAERRDVFTVAIRGMMTVPFWSPFIVGMAVASQYLPLVPLWQIMGLGLALTVMAILVSILLFDRNPGMGTLKRSLASLAPVSMPVFCAALIVVGATGTTGLSTLQALILVLPIPCILAVLTVRAGDLSMALRQTASGIGRIGPETSVLVCSTTLGAVFEAALPHMGLLAWLQDLSLPPWAVILIVIMSMNFAGLFGMHAIVTGTFLLVIFTSVPTGLTDLILMQALLVGWGLCSGISIGSLTVATGAAMFRIPPTDLITRANIAYVFLTSTIAAAILWGLNTLLV